MRELMWSRNLEAEKVEKYMKNLEEENRRMSLAFKEISSKMPFSREECGDFTLFHLLLPYGDFKTLQRRAMESVKGEKAIALFSIGNQVAVAVNPDLMELKSKFLSLLETEGGKGGGKGNFASGKVEDSEGFLEELKKIIC